MTNAEFLQKNGKVILIIIVIIILIVILKNNWDKIRHLFESRSVQTISGESTTISDSRKNEINSLAENLYNDLYHTNALLGHTSDYYTKALGLSDNELIYLAQYYTQYVSRSSSLYTDLSSDYFLPGSDADKLESRLSQVGQQ